MSDAAWAVADDWWDGEAGTYRPALEALRETFNAVDAVWRASDCRFDADPLASAIHPADHDRVMDGLARTVADSTGPFPAALFDAPIEGAPTSLRRDPSHPEIDLLATFDHVGITVSARGDECRRAEAARDVERRHPRFLAWDHWMIGADPRLEGADGTAVVPLETDPPIHATSWARIAAVLRRQLLAGDEPRDRWAAQAHVLTGDIEHERLGYLSRDAVRRALVGPPTVGLWDRIQDADLAAQRTHLEMTREVITHG